jgi:hypothetical protein
VPVEDELFDVEVTDEVVELAATVCVATSARW